MDDEKASCCDLVMKGGVTSGVVYPGAIQKISEQFHFVGIGGTSAGAIAASVTAAAEYRRRTTGEDVGFDSLSQISDEMSDPKRLLALFQPDKSTEHLLELALPFLTGKPGTIAKVWLGAKLGWKLLTRRRRNKFIRPLISNNFGVCSGMANDNKGSQTALTQWLSDMIGDVSGLPKGRHLTFRDLHDAPSPPGSEHLFDEDSRSIDFRAVTTCLTFNRPFEFPLANQDLAFDVKEWAKIFPESVLENLKESAKKIDADHLRRDGKLPLPTLDLPVIVAARMSLSFPVLFSAVPLWTINKNKAGHPLERIWFSDGGITSNFPVHRFDSIYPRWPTLAINFKSTDESGNPLRQSLQKSGKYVYMNPDREEEGLADIWSAISNGKDSQSAFFAFAFSIFRSAQNWHDNAFLRLPGFRDRVAEVWLQEGEGGLNLQMEKDTINRLTKLGTEAGEHLVNRYATLPSDNEMSWQGHKWTRFRSGMEGLTEAIEKFKRSVGDEGFEQSSLNDSLSGVERVPCFEFDNDTQREAARKVTQKLYELAQELEQIKAFSEGPRPPTEFGSRAPI